MNTLNLKDRINSFDIQYFQTSNQAKWDKWNREENAIERELKELTYNELLELKSEVTNDYFNIDKLITELKPVAAPKSKLSNIMSWAWSMLKDGLFSSMSEALKAAWKRFKLIESLKNGIARFSFYKADGSVRDAVGTLREGNFKYESKGSNAKPNYSVVKYYDIISNAWRSCNIQRLIQIG